MGKGKGSTTQAHSDCFMKPGSNKDCPVCYGTGTWKACDTCKGKGKTKCTKCGGSGIDLNKPNKAVNDSREYEYAKDFTGRYGRRLQALAPTSTNLSLRNDIPTLRRRLQALAPSSTNLCLTCDGKGILPGYSARSCSHCFGSGMDL